MGVVWGNECPFLKSDICMIYRPIDESTHIDCFFVYVCELFKSLISMHLQK